jgi:DNA-binding Lrp family transcriptional regulator
MISGKGYAMAAKAFILIETQVGKNREVTTALKNIKGISSVDPVTGPYDAIATIEVNNLSEIGELITGKIQAIPGISRTVTCLAIWST